MTEKPKRSLLVAVPTTQAYWSSDFFAFLHALEDTCKKNNIGFEYFKGISSEVFAARNRLIKDFREERKEDFLLLIDQYIMLEPKSVIEMMNLFPESETMVPRVVSAPIPYAPAPLQNQQIAHLARAFPQSDVDGLIVSTFQYGVEMTDSHLDTLPEVYRKSVDSNEIPTARPIAISSSLVMMNRFTVEHLATHLKKIGVPENLLFRPVVVKDQMWTDSQSFSDLCRKTNTRLTLHMGCGVTRLVDSMVVSGHGMGIMMNHQIRKAMLSHEEKAKLREQLESTGVKNVMNEQRDESLYKSTTQQLQIIDE